MRIGIWRVSQYTNDGIATWRNLVAQTLEELGCEVVVVGGSKPRLDRFDGCDHVLVSDATWSYGKDTAGRLLDGVNQLGELATVMVHAPVLRDQAKDVVRAAANVVTTRRHLLLDADREDAHEMPCYPYRQRLHDWRGVPRKQGLLATGRVWDGRKRLMAPLEQGWRGDYTMAGSGYFLKMPSIRQWALDRGAIALTEEPSSGQKPWAVRWPEGGELRYTGPYKDADRVPWQLGNVHFNGVEASWVGDPGHLEFTTLEAMDAGTNVVVPHHCIKGLDYRTLVSYTREDDLGELLKYSMLYEADARQHDLELHDPERYVRGLLPWLE